MKLILTYGDPFQSFLGIRYLKAVNHSLPLGAFRDCEVCSKHHSLAILSGAKWRIKLPVLRYSQHSELFRFSKT